ncbi:hypothetical protein GJ496_006108 [Pomphorhynchus laevis]|nr:hypothetical protein GJ496_006108 [Pomphorhynchus laevis]
MPSMECCQSEPIALTFSGSIDSLVDSDDTIHINEKDIANTFASHVLVPASRDNLTINLLLSDGEFVLNLMDVALNNRIICKLQKIIK